MSKVEMILPERPVFTPNADMYGMTTDILQVETDAVIVHDRRGTEICPECGAKLIHEAGCVRCLCGWSRC